MVFKCQPARERERGGEEGRGGRSGRGEVGRGGVCVVMVEGESGLREVFLLSCNKILTKKSWTGLKDCLTSVYLQLCMWLLTAQTILKDKKGLEEGAASVLPVSFLVVSSLLF